MNIALPNSARPKQLKALAAKKLKETFTALARGGFEKIFKHVDQLTVKRGVDTMGIDKFINQCALLAAGSGVVTGAGGFASMLIGVPLDIINLISQQFRLTMALSYHHTGKYNVPFADFIKIVATSLKIDTGLGVTKPLMEKIAEKLMLTLGGKTTRRLVPVVGAIIGGTANYLFIKKIADNLKEKYRVTLEI